MKNYTPIFKTINDKLEKFNQKSSTVLELFFNGITRWTKRIIIHGAPYFIFIKMNARKKFYIPAI